MSFQKLADSTITASPERLHQLLPHHHSGEHASPDRTRMLNPYCLRHITHLRYSSSCKAWTAFSRIAGNWSIIRRATMTATEYSFKAKNHFEQPPLAATTSTIMIHTISDVLVRIGLLHHFRSARFINLFSHSPETHHDLQLHNHVANVSERCLEDYGKKGGVKEELENARWRIITDLDWVNWGYQIVST